MLKEILEPLKVEQNQMWLKVVVKIILVVDMKMVIARRVTHQEMKYGNVLDVEENYLKIVVHPFVRGALEIFIMTPTGTMKEEVIINNKKTLI